MLVIVPHAGKSGNIFRDVVPLSAAVLGVPDLPVVRPRPDQSLSASWRARSRKLLRHKIVRDCRQQFRLKERSALDPVWKDPGLITDQLCPPFVVLKITWQP